MLFSKIMTTCGPQWIHNISSALPQYWFLAPQFLTHPLRKKPCHDSSRHCRHLALYWYPRHLVHMWICHCCVELLVQHYLIVYPWSAPSCMKKQLNVNHLGRYGSLLLIAPDQHMLKSWRCTLLRWPEIF